MNDKPMTVFKDGTDAEAQIPRLKPTTGEWTAEYVNGLYYDAESPLEAFKDIANAHNAQITAVYQKGKDDGYAEAYDRYANR